MLFMDVIYITLSMRIGYRNIQYETNMLEFEELYELF